jgi:hypothetical protein
LLLLVLFTVLIICLHYLMSSSLGGLPAGIVIMTTLHKDSPEGVSIPAAAVDGQRMSPRHESASAAGRAAIDVKKPLAATNLPTSSSDSVAVNVAPGPVPTAVVESLGVPKPIKPPMTPLAV